MQYHFERLRRRALKLRDFDAVLKRRKFRGLRDTFYDRLWAGAAKDIGAQVDKLHGLTRIKLGPFCTFMHHSDLMLDNIITTQMMADKAATYALIASRGHPVPEHCVFSLSELEKADAFLMRFPTGIVVKPARGTGGGNGVTVGVKSRRELHSAARHAASFNAKLLAEPLLEGSSLRLLYLDGVYLDAVRRDRPTVMGDGNSTLRRLIAEETKKRLQQEPIVALSPLTLDLDCRNQLLLQNLRLESRPEKGHLVAVKNVVNENASRDNHSVRAHVHPDIVNAGAQLVKDLNVTLAGLDILVEDPSAPLAEGGTYFHEINIGPGLHHHYLIANPDEGIPVATRILETMFSQQLGVMRV